MPRRTALLAVLLAGALLLPGEAGAASSWTSHSYANAKGRLTYKVFVPSKPAAGRPLVVVLHGGGETADTAAARSSWNEVAERFGFTAVYPEQNVAYNGQRTWDWGGSAVAGRGGREPSLISGITETVRRKHRADPRRVYVVGVSAGAGMANVMAVLFPDVYAAVGLYAGCAFTFVTCGGDALDENEAAAAAVKAMGRYARPVPAFSSYGGIDPISRGTRADLVIPSWLATGDLLDDGKANGSVSREPATSRLETPLPPEHPYEVTTFTDKRGCLIGESWVIHGESHAWPHGKPGNGQPVDPVTDPFAPDVPTATYRFFLAHRLAQPHQSPCR